MSFYYIYISCIILHCIYVQHPSHFILKNMKTTNNLYIYWFKYVLFLDYQRITLDRNTAHEYLKLSEWNRVVSNMNEDQSYRDHSDRFEHWYQVLSNESLNGRCYWEVEWNGSVHISVSYKGISRKGRGRKCEFGSNSWSWRLACSYYSCSFLHSGISITLPRVSSSSRIGVYVDHSAGTLSFYSVSDTMTLIHRVQTTFTQPLYAGFWVYYDAQVELCDPETE